MKRKLPLLLGATFLAFSAMACEGPVGPQGPAGEQGVPGEPGLNALNTCTDCHSSDATIVAIDFQFNNSPHAPGVFELRGPSYAGGSCVGCHTHQGFVEAASGVEADWTHGYTTMNCRTCHQIHSDVDGDGDLDVGDYAMTTTDPVDIIHTGNTVDFIGSHENVQYVGGNVCATCHQARAIGAAWPSASAPVSQMYTIGSFRFGPHYGPQANVLKAEFNPAARFSGSRSLPTGEMSHGTTYSCTGCHMQHPSPTQGGHTFTPNPETCQDCHTGASGSDFDFHGVQSDVQGLLDDLATCLKAVGVMRADGYAVEGSHPEPFVAAFLNHRMFYYDGSKGVHHPQFAFGLLSNTLQYMRNNSSACN